MPSAITAATQDNNCGVLQSPEENQYFGEDELNLQYLPLLVAEKKIRLYLLFIEFRYQTNILIFS